MVIAWMPTSGIQFCISSGLVSEGQPHQTTEINEHFEYCFDVCIDRVCGPFLYIRRRSVPIGCLVIYMR